MPQQVGEEHPVLRAGVARAVGDVLRRHAGDERDAEAVALDGDAGARLEGRDLLARGQVDRRVLVELRQLVDRELAGRDRGQRVVHLELVGEVLRGVLVRCPARADLQCLGDAHVAVRAGRQDVQDGAAGVGGGGRGRLRGSGHDERGEQQRGEQDGRRAAHGTTTFL